MQRSSLAVAAMGLFLLDCKVPTTWEIIGGPVPEGVETVIQVVKDLAPCDVVKRKRWGGVIEFMPEPFVCYDDGRLVNGCYPDTWLVRVWGAQSPLVEHTALPEELAHFVLCFACGTNCSEDEELQDLTHEIQEETAFRLGRTL